MFLDLIMIQMIENNLRERFGSAVQVIIIKWFLVVLNGSFGTNKTKV